MREAYAVTLDTSYLGSGDLAKATMGLREINLAGKARDNEIKFSELSPKDKISMLEAMKREWQKWTEFKATKYVSEHDFAEMRKQQPSLRVVGTRWVLTRKTPSGAFKARLVVQGCQEDRNAMRTDAPTGSRDALFLTLAAAAQKGFSLVSYDAESAYLQAEGINRLLLLRLPLVNPPPGCRPGQIVRAAGSIYGTRDAGMPGTSTPSRRSRRRASSRASSSAASTSSPARTDPGACCTRTSTTSWRLVTTLTRSYLRSWSGSRRSCS